MTLYKDLLARDGIRKFLNWALHSLHLDVRLRVDEYPAQFNVNGISSQALEAARTIRGKKRPPAIFLHGVMPRSGTVYVGKLLSLHPDIHAYPNDIWEFPFLKTTGELQRAQKLFFGSYRRNVGKIGENDFLPLFGAAMVNYLYTTVPEGKTMLLKIPDVRFLSFFYAVFPYERIILQLRDGRDVVNSTIKTWPGRDFGAACRQWNRSAEMILNFHRRFEGAERKTMLVKFEEIVANPDEFILSACDYLGLDASIYPFDKIEEVGVQGSSKLDNCGKVSWDVKSKPEGFNPVGRWRNWSRKNINKCKSICGKNLIAAGYIRDLDW